MNVDSAAALALRSTIPPVPIHPWIITKPRIAMPAVINPGADVRIRDATDQPELKAEQDE
jgi:hypothetical protein